MHITAVVLALRVGGHAEGQTWGKKRPDWALTAPYTMLSTWRTVRANARDWSSVGTRLAVYCLLYLVAPYCAATSPSAQLHSHASSACTWGTCRLLPETSMVAQARVAVCSRRVTALQGWSRVP